MNWKTETEYKILTVVKVFNEFYICKKQHKSNVFATDLFDNYYWFRPSKLIRKWWWKKTFRISVWKR